MPDGRIKVLLEGEIIKRNGFRRLYRVEKWEAFPNYYVNDHWLWEMKKCGH